MEDRLTELRGGMDIGKPGKRGLFGRSKSRQQIKPKHITKSKLNHSNDDNITDESTNIIDNQHNDNSLDHFYQQIGNLKVSLTKVSKQIEKLSQAQVESLTNYKDESPQSAIDHQTQIINQQLTAIKDKLQLLKSENENTSDSQDKLATQIKQNIINTVSIKLLKIIEGLHSVQSEYRVQCQERMVSRYRIVNPNATQDEIQSLVSTGMMDQISNTDLFQTTVLYSNLNNEARQALLYVEQRHSDIKKLEISIQELHQLFIDMQLLVAVQGEILDHIEPNVINALENTASGTENLRKARSHQKKARRKLYLLLLIVTIGLAAIIVPTALKFKPF